MEQIKFYKYSTIFLLILNIVLIVWFFLKGPPPPSHKMRNGKTTASEILNLSESQNGTFLDLADQHMDLMNGLSEDQSELIKSYFKNLFNDIEENKSEILLPKIQDLEKKKIESTFNHFQDIKAMLKPEQQKDFERFIEHALARILS